MSREYTPRDLTAPWLTCRCGKRGYPSRSAAKKALRRAHPDKSQMHAYRCDIDASHWHLGHIAQPIKRGAVDRDTYYARKGSA